MCEDKIGLAMNQKMFRTAMHLLSELGGRLKLDEKGKVIELIPETPFSHTNVFSKEVVIENNRGKIKIDFANKEVWALGLPWKFDEFEIMLKTKPCTTNVESLLITEDPSLFSIDRFFKMPSLKGGKDE